MLRFRFARDHRGSSTLAQRVFMADQVERLTKVRARYQQGHDQQGHDQQGHDDCSEREIAHLQFLRWLIRAGRLASNTADAR